MVGWSSNRKYALLGAVRAMAQVVSYEVVMLTLVVVPVLLLGRGDLLLQQVKVGKVGLFAVLWPVFIVWVICVGAEANRAPFDFAEGERELVSGFNVEFRGASFAIIFLGEYLALVFLCLFSCCLFFGRRRSGVILRGLIFGQGCVLSCAAV